MNKKIETYLFKPGKTFENFGEYLCEQIINQFGYDCIRHWMDRPTNDCNGEILTAIGGLFNSMVYSRFDREVTKWHIWGTGLECKRYPNIGLPKEIREKICNITMLRGPLTYEYYNLTDNILFGDPGYLTSYFFKNKGEKKNVCIQFYEDTRKRKIEGVDIHLSSLLANDYKTDFNNILNAISNANIVLTGSMHIMIATHSYNTPWALISKEHTPLENEWKWHDTLATIGLDKSDIKICNSVCEGLEWWNSIKYKIRPITPEYQKQILDAFPKI